MASLDDIVELKEKVNALQEKKQKAAGALEQTIKQLKEEFGCRTIEEAKKILAKLKKEEDEIEEELDDEIPAFEKKWEDVLKDA